MTHETHPNPSSQEIARGTGEQLTDAYRSMTRHKDTLDGIHALLDTASIMADAAGQDEQLATDPFTSLAQLIDNALARVEALQGEDA